MEGCGPVAHRDRGGPPGLAKSEGAGRLTPERPREDDRALRQQGHARGPKDGQTKDEACHAEGRGARALERRAQTARAANARSSVAEARTFHSAEPTRSIGSLVSSRARRAAGETASSRQTIPAARRR